jgi:hypothetical protein
MNTPVMKSTFQTILIAVLALGVWVTPALAKPGGPNGTQGLYSIVFAGGFTGEGHATVNKLKVAQIHGKVTDAATGATGFFKADNLDLDNGHFTGTGTVMGVQVTISGRVESPDGKIVLTPRITCTFTTTSGVGGRICGQK